MTNLKINYLPTEQITPYEHNAKVHNSKQIEQIVKSITEFYFNNPILIDENNVVIAGHGRLLAAQKLQLQEVPVIQLLHLNDAQKRAYRIADNKLTENGKWDVDLLKLEFTELDKLELDFSLDITGFDIGDIDVILDDSLTQKNNSLDEAANTIPFIKQEDVITKDGDIWILGNHRIICGDALKSETYHKLFKDKKADMVFTDPPYNVKIDGHVCGNGRVKHKEFKMASGEMKSEEFQEFLATNFNLLREFSKNGSLHYICMDWRHIKEIINAGSNIYQELKNLCVWNKGWYGFAI